MTYRTKKEIFAHNERWIKEQLENDPEYFNKLSERQIPNYLFISCSDSRLSTDKLMYAEPGDVFIHRNIGNVISVTYLNVLSVINYAVVHLEVKHIIVCGHYGCGAIKTAITTTDVGILNPWLGNVRDVYRLHREELEAIKSIDDRVDRLVELNVIEQCVNLVRVLDVQKALLDKKLEIEAWVFDMRTGKLIDLGFDNEKMIMEIIDNYNLN